MTYALALAVAMIGTGCLCAIVDLRRELAKVESDVRALRSRAASAEVEHAVLVGDLSDVRDRLRARLVEIGASGTPAVGPMATPEYPGSCAAPVTIHDGPLTFRITAT